MTRLNLMLVCYVLNGHFTCFGLDIVNKSRFAECGQYVNTRGNPEGVHLFLDCFVDGSQSGYFDIWTVDSTEEGNTLVGDANGALWDGGIDTSYALNHPHENPRKHFPMRSRRIESNGHGTRMHLATYLMVAALGTDSNIDFHCNQRTGCGVFYEKMGMCTSEGYDDWDSGKHLSASIDAREIAKQIDSSQLVVEKMVGGPIKYNDLQDPNSEHYVEGAKDLPENVIGNSMLWADSKECDALKAFPRRSHMEYFGYKITYNKWQKDFYVNKGRKASWYIWLPRVMETFSWPGLYRGLGEVVENGQSGAALAYYRFKMHREFYEDTTYEQKYILPHKTLTEFMQKQSSTSAINMNKVKDVVDKIIGEENVFIIPRITGCWSKHKNWNEHYLRIIKETVKMLEDESVEINKDCLNTLVPLAKDVSTWSWKTMGRGTAQTLYNRYNSYLEQNQPTDLRRRLMKLLS